MSRLIIAVFLLACGMAQADQILTNPSFESGSIAPWTDDNRFGSGTWSITNAGCNSGFCATVDGNVGLIQTFTPVAVSDITDISFYAEHPGGASALAVDLLYSGGGDDEFIVETTDEAWDFFDVFADLRATGSLDGFEVFGNSGGVTLLDDTNVSAASAAPEPASFGLALVGLMGAVGARVRARRSTPGSR